ncbi:MAG TPA: DUF302 domain-containing protein [Thiobacillaceae bacterium]|nr:DUF302 domain-containing protein [Thiobacillaceae bacterium]
MKKSLLALAAILTLSTPVLAQQPAAPQAPMPQMTKEQMQQVMMRQMAMMAAMFDMRVSRLGFEETVNALKTAAEKRGWKVDRIQDVQAEMVKAGVKDARPMKVLHGCPPGANDKLAKAGQGKLPPLPCRYTVMDDKDGKVRVVKLNTGMIAKANPSEVGKVLGEVAAEEDALLQGLVQ